MILNLFTTSSGTSLISTFAMGPSPPCYQNDSKLQRNLQKIPASGNLEDKKDRLLLFSKFGRIRILIKTGRGEEI
jgi:hypothetical protein